MLRNLFEEYKFFPQYPDKELHITAQLFGGIIEQGLVRYVLFTHVMLISITNLMHKFFYSITICMLHYNPRHILSINMPIFRRTNCIITASDIVALCKRLYSVPDGGRLRAVIIQFVLLRMGMLMLETCQGL
jgi:hypothetical protein